MDLSSSTELRLVEALQPIRGFVVAAALHHLFHSGLYDAVAGGEHDEAALITGLELDPVRAEALLQFLRNEGYLGGASGRVHLLDKARALAEFRGWYTMLIGGYGQTFLELGDKLQLGSGSASRRADLVGIGSCAISHYDAIPLTRRLMAKIPGGVKRVLDLGCGNALYLVEFCKLLPHIEAWGVEPDRKGYEAAVALVEREQLHGRIRLTCSGAVEFFRAPLEFSPDLTVLGFVLHEILGQEGEAGVVEFLRQITTRFPQIHLVVIEVDQQMANPRVMRHGLSLAYYNAYYLFHPFTRQRLETRAFWLSLFRDAGLAVVAEDSVTPEVDSTGLELGFLLRRADRPSRD
jgi:2-ketoarginine methyltransferase